MYTILIFFYIGMASIAATLLVLAVYDTKNRSSSTKKGAETGLKSEADLQVPEGTESVEAFQIEDRADRSLSVPKINDSATKEIVTGAKQEAGNDKPETAKEQESNDNNQMLNEYKILDKTVLVQPEAKEEDKKVASHPNPPANTAASKNDRTVQEQLKIQESRIQITPKISHDNDATSKSQGNTQQSLNTQTKLTEEEKAMDTKPVIGFSKPGSEQTQIKPEPIQEPVKTNNQRPAENKNAAKDFSELFAKTAVEDSETSQIVVGMKEVDVQDLLKEGLEIMSKLKRPKA